MLALRKPLGSRRIEITEKLDTQKVMLDLNHTARRWIPYDEIMGASFLEQDSYEFRWTIATLAALTCCAITLSAVTVLWTTGDRFDYRPASSGLSRSDDHFVQAFAALRAIEAKQEFSRAPRKILQSAAVLLRDGAAI